MPPLARSRQSLMPPRLAPLVSSESHERTPSKGRSSRRLLACPLTCSPGRSSDKLRRTTVSPYRPAERRPVASFLPPSFFISSISISPNRSFFFLPKSIILNKSNKTLCYVILSVIRFNTIRDFDWTLTQLIWLQNFHLN